MTIVQTTEEAALSIRAGGPLTVATNPEATVSARKPARDVEGDPASVTTERSDPYHLQNGIKTSDELAGLRKRREGRALEKYHRKQNDLISSLLKSMEEHTEEARVEEETSRLPVKIAIWASLIGNFALCILQRKYFLTCITKPPKIRISLRSHLVHLALLDRHFCRLCV